MNRTLRRNASLAIAAGLITAAAGAYAQAYAPSYRNDAPATTAPYGTDAPGSSYTGLAEVLSATPVVERVTEPGQRCQIETYSPSGTVTTRPSGPPGTYALPGSAEVERCYDTSTTRDVVRGYDVVYRYDGRQFTTRLPYDPGPRIAVQIAVTPATR